MGLGEAFDFQGAQLVFLDRLLEIRIQLQFFGPALDDLLVQRLALHLDLLDGHFLLNDFPQNGLVPLEERVDLPLLELDLLLQLPLLRLDLLVLLAQQIDLFVQNLGLALQLLVLGLLALVLLLVLGALQLQTLDVLLEPEFPFDGPGHKLLELLDLGVQLGPLALQLAHGLTQPLGLLLLLLVRLAQVLPLSPFDQQVVLQSLGLLPELLDLLLGLLLGDQKLLHLALELDQLALLLVQSELVLRDLLLQLFELLLVLEVLHAADDLGADALRTGNQDAGVSLALEPDVVQDHRKLEQLLGDLVRVDVVLGQVQGAQDVRARVDILDGRVLGEDVVPAVSLTLRRAFSWSPRARGCRSWSRP